MAEIKNNQAANAGPIRPKQAVAGKPASDGAPAKPKVAGDRLALSPAARQAANNRKPASDVPSADDAPKQPDLAPKADRGPANAGKPATGNRLAANNAKATTKPIANAKPTTTPAKPTANTTGGRFETRVAVTNRDVTASTDLGDRTRLTARQVTNSPTMMNGASLVEVEHDFGEGTTAFAGYGHLPNFFEQSIGPNEKVAAPRDAAFAGLEDRRDLGWELGHDLRLDWDTRSVAVATMAWGKDGLDWNTTGGLSKATITSEARLSRQFGNFDMAIGYGQHFDLGMMGAYYVTGGKGLFPTTQFLDASVAGKVGPATLRADAYVPITTATSEFADTAKLRAAISAPNLPELSAVASPNGLERIEARQSWALGNNGWAASAEVAADRPFGPSPAVSAMVGLSFTPGGHKPSRDPLPADPDYRAEAPRARATGTWRTAEPHLKDFFTDDQIASMKGKSVEELAKVLKTPEEVAAYDADFVTYDDARLANSHGDNGSLTPNQVAALLTGVCRDQHPFMLEVMHEGAGIEGHTVGYLSPDTSHAIAVYQDPKSGKWNVIEYGKVHYTEADTADDAFTRVRPDALTWGDWKGNGPDTKRYQADIHYSETAREWYRFVQPSEH